MRLSFAFEDAVRARGFAHVIGCDEVGRGCLAGPVVAAAIILPDALLPSEQRDVIRDSKTLSRKQRREVSAYLRQHALAYAIAEVTPEVIDEINIHQASLLAMHKSVAQLMSSSTVVNAHLAIDGRFCIPGLALSQEAVIDGDAKIISIAAASIIAKEYRDCLLEELDGYYPQYGFAAHKGYATAQHRAALRQYGLTPEHRKTFCHV